MVVKNVLQSLSGFIVALLIATFFYYPALFTGKTLIHAEIASHGIPLLDILSNALHGGATALWTDKMYGGHPIFAEGQGGFAHPLNIMVAWLFAPIVAYSVLAWLGMLLSGLGSYLMCRSFGCSRTSSLFAEVALILSPLWILGQSNLSVGATITWVPWAIWAMNCWLNRADLRSAGLFGLVMSLMVLAGYPHIVHATVVYMVVYIALNLGFQSKRAVWLSGVRVRIATGLLAVVICVGLSAVQLLPLLELVSNSQRSDGASLLPWGVMPVDKYIRGLLYTYNRTNSGAFPAEGYWPVIGSLLVCVIASTALLQRKTAEIVSHGGAALILFVLGIGASLPFFAYIYEHHWVPGLSNFRIMYPYLYLFMIGVVVISAMSLDSLAASAKQRCALRWLRNFISLLVLLSWGAFWIGLNLRFHTSDSPLLQYVTVGLWLLGSSIIFYFQAGRLLPVLALLLLCVEAGVLRVSPFYFSDTNVFETPKTVKQIEGEDLYEEFKVADTTTATLLQLTPPRSPALAPAMRKVFSSLTPSTTLLWGVSNIAGNTALPLTRRALAEPLLQSELIGQSGSNVGLRLIDFMSVKYIVVNALQGQTGFREFYRDTELNVLLAENPNARPRFQIFHEVMEVSSTEEALQALTGIDRPILLLETKESELVDMSRLAWTEGVDQVDIRVISANSGNYRLTTTATQATWLLVADADYPGWNAYLDGKATDLFTAQVLGKAVFVPAGRHELRLVFEPSSFRIGLLVSILFLIALLPITIWQQRKPSTKID